MDRKMMYIGDDGIARPFSGEKEMVGVIKSGAGDPELKALKKEVRILRKLVSRYRSHLVYDKCHCTAELQGLCVRCRLIEAIDTDLAKIAKEAENG